MARHADPGRERGASLVEAIVALGLLALFTLLLLQGLGMARNLWQGAAGRAASAEGIEGAQTVLRERLSALYVGVRYDAPVPYPDVEGSAVAFSFTAPLPQAQGSAGLARYRLGLEAGGDLVLTGRIDAGRREDGPVWREVLLRGVGAIDLAYLDAAGESPTWRESWSKEPALPSLIRLRLRFRDGDGRWWPDFLVRPMINVDGDCVLYDEGARCAGRG